MSAKFNSAGESGPDPALPAVSATLLPPKRVKVMSTRPHSFDSDLLLGVADYANHFAKWNLSTPMAEPYWFIAPDEELDGLIVRVHPEAPNEGRSIEQLRCDCPIVTICTPDLSEGNPVVYWDAAEAGRVIARHLLEQGHGNFCVLGDMQHTTSRLRIEAFREAVIEHGFGCGISLPPSSEDRAAWSDLVESWEKPMAVMATSDMVGRILLDETKRMQQEVPEAIALVGASGDRLVCEMNSPQMSSIELPVHRVGFEAAALLARLMDGEPEPDEALLLPPGGVVERESSFRTVSNDPEVNLALRFIREHATLPIEVADIVRAVPLSRRALELRFKRLVGQTLQKELWRVRILRAQSLLMDTELPMPDIAERAGFQNAQRLYEVFKRDVGISPTEYRVRCRGPIQKNRAAGHHTH
ncbi:MAG: substrate-binding domain-containing protein [Planctomycetota bacterium]